MNETASYQEMMERKKKAREVIMSPFKGNDILTNQIPEIAAKVFEEEFGIKLRIKETPQLAFIKGWQAYDDYAHSQPTPEFAINVAGVSLEYITDLSESDKSRNIVPQLIYHQDPIFKAKPHSEHIGIKSNADMAEDYQRWRNENLTETVEKIDTDVSAILLEDFGIDTGVTTAIVPLMGATFAAGLQIARTIRQTINMYNIFEIDIADGDVVILTPLADIKQNIKNDDIKG